MPPTASGRARVADLLANLAQADESLDAAGIAALLVELAAVHGRLASRLVQLATAAPPAEPPTSAEDGWLTVEEVGQRLKKSPTTVRRDIRRARFPGARRMGGQWRIPLAAVEKYEAT